jgi:hypothetical protein
VTTSRASPIGFESVPIGMLENVPIGMLESVPIGVLEVFENEIVPPKI